MRTPRKASSAFCLLIDLALFGIGVLRCIVAVMDPLETLSATWLELPLIVGKGTKDMVANRALPKTFSWPGHFPSAWLVSSI